MPELGKYRFIQLTASGLPSRACRRWCSIPVAFMLFFVVIAVRAEAEPPTLRIGALYGLTGPMTDLSEQYHRGAQLAARHLRDAGIINIDLIVEDTKWEASAAVTSYRKLRSADSVSIVHILGSGPTLAVKPLTEAEGVLLFTSAAHAAILPNSELILRHANRADHDAEVLVQSLPEARQIAVISLENEWARDYANHTQKALHVLRPTAKIAEHTHLPKESDFRSVLLQAVRSKPELLIINSFGAAAGHLILQARQIGFRGPIVANNGFTLSPDATTVVQGHELGELLVQDYFSPPEEFRKLYHKTFGEEPRHAALLAFDDIEIIGRVAASVGVEPKTIVATVKSMGRFEGSFDTIDIEKNGDMLVPTVMRRWQ